MTREAWAVADAYEQYVGRWSRAVAAEFLDWLDVPGRATWLDVGCGTGALAAAVLDRADPAQVTGVDPSQPFLALARTQVVDPRVDFHAGDAQQLPFPDARFQAVVSALALNFVPQPARAVAEFRRVLVAGGVAAAYVWDYADGMQLMRYFWDAAIDLDPAVAAIDEMKRFGFCQPEPLRALWTAAGLTDVASTAIEVPTTFVDFDDYWNPFLGGQGPAPAYAMSLSEPDRAALRELVRSRLPVAPDGSIPLTARAYAVRGTR